ncbi:MAG: hypothetical protein H7836_11860 [Magnetococcus sp. YQC-3]
MNAGVGGPNDITLHSSLFMTAHKVSSQSPSRSTGDSSPLAIRDNVDLGSVDSMSKTFQLLNERNRGDIPEPVGQAIQKLLQNVLDGLPESRRIIG